MPERFTINTAYSYVLYNIPIDDREPNYAVLRYLEHLATQAAVSRFGAWDLKCFLVEPKDPNSNLIQDKHIINKIFFEKLEKLNSKKASQEDAEFETIDKVSTDILFDWSQIVEDLIAEEADYKDRFLTSKLQKQKDEKGFIDNDIRGYYSRIKQLLEKRGQILIEINTLSQAMENEHVNVDDIKNLVVSLQEQNQWVNPVITDGYLYAHTAQELILNDIVHRRSHNVGSFTIQIHLHSYFTKVFPHKNNFFKHHYYHPHVDYSDGYVCWGNAGDIAMTAQKDRSLFPLLDITYQLLNSYSESNPYITLSDMMTGVKKENSIANFNLPKVWNGT